MSKVSFLLLCLLFMACGSQKGQANYGIEKIDFGGGGGFTGTRQSYRLSSQGKLYKDSLLLKTIEKQQQAAIFKKAAALKTYHYKKRGNVYSFISIKTQNQTNTIIWPPRSKELKPAVKKLYHELKLIVKK